MAAPGERGRVPGRSCCAGAAGMRAAASRPGPVLVRAGDGFRAPDVGATAPGAGAVSVACSSRPITSLMHYPPHPLKILTSRRSSTNLEHAVCTRNLPNPRSLNRSRQMRPA